MLEVASQHLIRPVIRVMSSSGMTVFCLCYIISANYELIPPGSVSWHPERWGLPLGTCGARGLCKVQAFLWDGSGSWKDLLLSPQKAFWSRVLMEPHGAAATGSWDQWKGMVEQLS